MRKMIYSIILITGLFLILFYSRAVAEVITATSGAIGGTITRLQGGV